MKKLILLLFLPTSSLIANDNIFDEMDEKIAITTGIYKLSSQEKEALINWLQVTKIAAKQQVEKQVRQQVREEIKQEVREEVKEEVKQEVAKEERNSFMGFSPKESKRETIHSSLVGEFDGWRGKTIFKLANGQVWKQVQKTSFFMPKKNNLNITITPKSFGSWALSVDGYNRGVKVTRIK